MRLFRKPQIFPKIVSEIPLSAFSEGTLQVSEFSVNIILRIQTFSPFFVRKLVLVCQCSRLF
ncbi:hypothetical protein ACI760_05970 [Capnocytophaga canimorsus]